jgi:Na+-translocating ferredoxin:NAD+ oxidoreductase subunit A
VNIPVILQIAIGAVLINNFVLARMLGLCPFFCNSRNTSNAFGMGITITFIMGISTACTWAVNDAVLIPHHITYLQILVFILIIATLVELTEMAMQKFSPKLNEALGMNLSLVIADCAVLAAALINTRINPVTGQPFTLAEACINGIASGVGFTVVLMLMAGIREKLELAHGWKSMQGLPLALIIAGLMAMAFFGFTGLHFASAGGGF